MENNVHLRDSFQNAMAGLFWVFLFTVLQIGFSMPTCQECVCCSGGHQFCDTNNNCIDGCIAGYYGERCTNEYLQNCRSCVNGYECTECRPGYYSNKCNLLCGKGCVNNTCSVSSGECSCRSANFVKGRCEACLGNKYGDECNKTCPSNCGSCISETECSWCQYSVFYGSYCQYKCSVGCVDGRCNKGNGHCTGGCKSNFVGDKCYMCSHGLYGRFCDLNCTENCSACFSETNCTKCKSGFYGETCTNTCPIGCKGNCYLANGRCLECKPGLFGDFCNITCNDETYRGDCYKLCGGNDVNCQVCILNELGDYGGCTKCYSGYYPLVVFGSNHGICTKCPSNCNNNVCDNTGGLCIDGCVRGKWGDKCTTNCKANCLQCNQRHGECLNCTSDTYLDNCSQNCSTKCKRADSSRNCEKDTGACLLGCKSETNYGVYCEKHCSDSCNNRSCDWKTGQCLKGCVANYYGSFCDTLCPFSCLPNNGKRVCDDINGRCLLGCRDGFYGEKCNNKCSSLCVNTTCNQITGKCLYGCIHGFKGPECLEALIPVREGYSKGTLTGSILGAFLVGGIVAFAVLFVFIKLRQRFRNNGHTENTSASGKYRSKDITHEDGSPVAYEDFNSRVDISYSQISTNQQISPPEAVYVNTRF